MSERHPGEFGRGTATVPEDRDPDYEERTAGDGEALEPGAEERAARLRTTGAVRPGEAADQAFERLREELGIEYGEPEHQAYIERFTLRPTATLEEMAAAAADGRTEDGTPRQEPPEMPDRGSGHAGGKGGERQEQARGR